jgi:hypothetical protein
MTGAEDKTLSIDVKLTDNRMPRVEAAACPTNQRIGRRVDSLTLKALLAVSLTEVRPIEYRFCREADCPTVYYSADGTQCFEESALRERVFQKHPTDDDVWICYCFRHTLGTLRAELAETGNSMVVEAITAAIQAEQCACDIRNPQGTCCLGNVRAAVKKLKAGLS